MKKLKDEERLEIRELIKVTFILLGMATFFAVLFLVALAFYLHAAVLISCPLLTEGHCGISVDL